MYPGSQFWFWLLCECALKVEFSEWIYRAGDFSVYLKEDTEARPYMDDKLLQIMLIQQYMNVVRVPWFDSIQGEWLTSTAVTKKRIWYGGRAQIPHSNLWFYVCDAYRVTKATVSVVNVHSVAFTVPQKNGTINTATNGTSIILTLWVI